MGGLEEPVDIVNNEPGVADVPDVARRRRLREKEEDAASSRQRSISSSRRGAGSLFSGIENESDVQHENASATASAWSDPPCCGRSGGSDGSGLGARGLRAKSGRRLRAKSGTRGEGSSSGSTTPKSAKR